MAQLQLEMLAAPADSALLVSRSASKVLNFHSHPLALCFLTLSSLRFGKLLMSVRYINPRILTFFTSCVHHGHHQNLSSSWCTSRGST